MELAGRIWLRLTARPNVGRHEMRTLYAILIAVSAVYAAASDAPPSEPRMSLSDRVAEATLIVIAKLGPPGNTGRHTTTSLRVEEVLCGSFPTNKALFVSYSGTRWLIPDMFSR